MEVSEPEIICVGRSTWREDLLSDFSPTRTAGFLMSSHTDYVSPPSISDFSGSLWVFSRFGWDLSNLELRK